MAASPAGGGVQVKGPDVRKLGDILYAAGRAAVSGTPEQITVQGKTGEEIGRLIAEHQIVISELSPIESSLEEIYFELTGATGTGGPS